MPAVGLRGFTERVALVTGGTQEATNSVARAVALQLALEGAYVIVTHGAQDTGGKRTAEILREMGTLAHAVEVDAQRADDIANVFATINNLYGRLDLMVNIAVGVAAPRNLLNAELAAIDETWCETLRASILFTQHARQELTKRGGGAIVNVVKATSREQDPAATSVESIFNAAIIELTRLAAEELAPRIRVNGVRLGRPRAGIKKETGGARADDLLNFAAVFESSTNPATPFENFVAADEAARAVLYLLSPEAKFVTGQILTVGV